MLVTTITTISRVLNFLSIIYVLGTSINKRQYQVGVFKKKLVCIELENVVEASTDTKKRPSANNKSIRQLNTFGEFDKNIVSISKVFVLIQILSKYMKYKKIHKNAKKEIIQVSLPPNLIKIDE